MKLSIIIVSWNVKDQLIRCLASLYKNHLSAEFEVIVVDNAGIDDTVEAVGASFPQVITLVNAENRGFAAANNQGIERSRGEYILLLNPDTVVHPHSLNVLADFMDENKDVAACGPKLLNEDGTIQHSARRFPTFRAALYRHTAFRFLRLFREEYKSWLMKDFDHKTQMDVDQIMGAALMVKRSVIDRIGAMDEQFFMYYEEVDLCYRVRQAGWRVVFVPTSVITHSGGQSSAQAPVGKRIMMLTSLLAFFRKHRGAFVTAAFNLIFKPAILLRDICDVLTGVLTYLFSIAAANSKRRSKSAIKIKNSLQLIGKYGWKLINT